MPEPGFAPRSGPRDIHIFCAFKDPWRAAEAGGPPAQPPPIPSLCRSSFFSTDASGTGASVHGRPTAAPQPLKCGVPASAARDPPTSASTRHLPSRPPPAGPLRLAVPSPAENQNPPGAPQSPPLGRQSALKFGIGARTTAQLFLVDRTLLRRTELCNADGLLIYRLPSLHLGLHSLPPRNHLRILEADKPQCYPLCCFCLENSTVSVGCPPRKAVF